MIRNLANLPESAGRRDLFHRRAYMVGAIGGGSFRATGIQNPAIDSFQQNLWRGIDF
jgi:hypothetical protein